MYEVFNMGCGFVCVVAADDEEAALELLRGHYPAAKRIGTVTDRAGVVERSARSSYPLNARRYAVGVVAVARRKCSRSEGAEPKPDFAAHVLDRKVGVLEQAAGLEDALAVQPLERCRAGLGDEAAGEGARADARRGRRGSATSSGSVRCSSAQRRTGSRDPSPGAAGSGRSMNWAWPPSRCGEATIAGRPASRSARRGRCGRGAGRDRCRQRVPPR